MPWLGFDVECRVDGLRTFCEVSHSHTAMGMGDVESVPVVVDLDDSSCTVSPDADPTRGSSRMPADIGESLTNDVGDLPGDVDER